MYEDDYEGCVTASFVMKWWNQDRIERQKGSGGHNKIKQPTREQNREIVQRLLKIETGRVKTKIEFEKVPAAVEKAKNRGTEGIFWENDGIFWGSEEFGRSVGDGEKM